MTDLFYYRETASPSVAWRLQAINTLQSLACAFAHPGQSSCEVASVHGPVLPLIPVYLTCLTKLQGGVNTESRPTILRTAQDAFSYCLRHHSQGFSEEKFSAAKDFIRAGLQDSSRSTRLAAGYVNLSECYRL